MRPPVYLEGAAVEFSFADASRNLSELIFDCVRAAVDDSGQPMEAIDSVVLASHDLVDGRSLSSMVTAPAAGAYLRDEVRYSDDGAAAFAAAVVRLEAGHAQRSIVAAWGRSSEHDPDQFSRALFDPFMSRPLGLDEFVLSALRAQLCLVSAATKHAHADATRSRGEAAQANPRALKQGGFRSRPHHPLLESDMPLWADITAAVVLSTEPSPVRVTGVGQSSEPFSFGARDPRTITSLATAAGRALAEAGVAPAGLDVVELDGLTLIDEALALEAVGMAAAGTGLQRLATDPRCNPSGGGAAGYSIPCMGLVRIIEAALQLRGRAGAVQQDSVRRVLASGGSTVAGQTQAAVVMENA
ncbi:MAG: thiolase family protein [Candidatus Dormibacteria bacterium]